LRREAPRGALLDGAEPGFSTPIEEVIDLVEARGRGAGTDPAELWKQWFEIGSKMWTDLLRGAGESYVDPYGLYRQWFEGMEAMRERVTAGGAESIEVPEAQEMWRRWFDASVESWQKSAELSREMMELTPRWIEMLEQAQQNLMSTRSFPKDPLDFAVQWYNATSGPFSEFVQDILEREDFLEPASRWLQSYASFYKVFKRRSEEYLSNLQIPVRSDITRVAGLIVALEDKVDRIEEAFEEFEYGYAKPATAEEVDELEKRLDRVEEKLDRVLSALESSSPNGRPAEPEDTEATEAARRTARELGVDLAEVEGTGSEGRITVEDVRRKGAAS
jgi:polyhydroxyalkanoic acid synthase PhaR subunit